MTVTIRFENGKIIKDDRRLTPNDEFKLSQESCMSSVFQISNELKFKDYLTVINLAEVVRCNILSMFVVRLQNLPEETYKSSYDCVMGTLNEIKQICDQIRIEIKDDKH